MPLYLKDNYGADKHPIFRGWYNHKLTATGKIVRSIRASSRERQKRYLKAIEHYYMASIIDGDYLEGRQAAFLEHAKGTKDMKFLNNRLNSIKKAKKVRKDALEH